MVTEERKTAPKTREGGETVGAKTQQAQVCGFTDEKTQYLPYET